MTAAKRKKQLGILAIILLLFFGGFSLYRYLMPKGPIVDDIPNLVNDKSSKDIEAAEASVNTNPLRNLYFGDLHVHTSLSFDAYIGGTRSTPESAYRFAKGEATEVLGTPVQIRRPLDFAAVTDHAEFMGELYSIQTPGAPAYGSLMARYFRSIGTDTTKQRNLFNRVSGRMGDQERNHLALFQGFETTKSAWKVTLEAADKHYEPGKFTTFAAYEWSLSGLRPNGTLGAHYHRNIIFKNMMVPDYPVSALEAQTPEKLWEWLEEISKAGAEVMAIPHNTNLSGGGMFLDTDQDGKPIDEAYVQQSNKYEPLIEVHQAKGNSEVHQAFWSNDEFSDFENYVLDSPMVNNYVRYALKKGLKDKANLGTNPYQYGMIGSTDTHNGIPGNTEEDGDFIGNHARLDLNPKNRKISSWVLDPSKKTYEVVNPGGLVAVWAEANTRGHIYDAMKRKETYATSGGRIQLRFFAGYDFNTSPTNHDELFEDAYQNGVPMGSDLEIQEGQSPQFLIWAAKDPEGANLDRVQVIKGWYENGELHETIYTAAVSDNRTIEEDGSVADTDAAIDWDTGAWDESKGAVELKTIWTDPDFNSNAHAFYYLRVLELPTPSWRGWDKIKHGIKFPEGTPLTVRERAWSSPIWYSPK